MSECKFLFVAALCFGMSVSAASATVVISNGPTANMSCASGVCSPTAKKAVLNVGDLMGMLASGDVVVQSGAQAQDIEIKAKFRWKSAHGLTLDAYRSLVVESPVLVVGPGALTINTDDGGVGGDYRFFQKGAITFRDTSNSLTINGTQFVLVQSIEDIATIVNQGSSSPPNLALAGNYNAADNGIYTSAPIPKYSAPIGTNATFEGLGNTISNFAIDGNEQETGLIGDVSSQVVIRDLNVTSVNINAHNGVIRAGVFAQMETNSTVKYCHVTGAISSSAPNLMVGGLVGLSLGTISGSDANVTVSTGRNGYGGGLVGGSTYKIDNSFASGSVAGGSQSQLGGLAGFIESSPGSDLENVYATGAVTGDSGAAVGGLLGRQQGVTAFPILNNSYSVGAVSAPRKSPVGGLIGEDFGPSTNTNCYWDLDTSGVSDPSDGAGNRKDDPGITGLSTAQLKSSLPAGFDKKIWAENANINNGYPYLLSNPPR
ncbi:MAG TPA: hypothetical protein VMF58_16610 [Rhizomicrobium sp.]|nr:hypothetical protein [Rhizomicrobium sp.]